MNKEFEKLYNKWYADTALLSHRDFKNEPGFVALVEWSKEHKKEAVESIREMLIEEPSFVVYVLDELFDHSMTCEGFVPLDHYCNAWIAIIDFYNSGAQDTNKFSISHDYYEDWRAYQKYLKDHYISWNPFKENDPNVTLEEFKMGKRNNPNYSRPIQMVQLKEENFKNN
jgi:hypothetical protein